VNTWLMALRLATRSLARNKLRAGLTVLGILIGVAAVVAMTALGEGAKENIERQLSNLGVNLLWVYPGASNSGGARGEAGSRPTLNEDDGAAISREVVSVLAIAPVIMVSTQVVVGARNAATRITGTTPDFLRARAWPIRRGRAFEDAEMRTAAKACLIGETVRQALFDATEDPIGRTIRLGKMPCTVIGLLAVKGQGSFGQDYDDTVLLPITTVRARLRGNTNRDVDNLVVSVREAGMMRRAQEQITALLRQRHRLQASDENDFMIRNLQDIMATMEQTRSTLATLLLSIAAIALLVGGIGVMNIMLVSVTERTREIGIRLAIGARANDILLQFLIEAVTLAAIGGVAGVAVGIGASVVVGRLTDFSVGFQPDVAAFSMVVSGGIGVIFGYFPARSAARLDPIVALRRE